MAPRKKPTAYESAKGYFLAEAKSKGYLQQSEILDRADELHLKEEEYEKLVGELSAAKVTIKDEDVTDEGNDSSEAVAPSAVSSSDTLKLYLSEMGKYPLLTREQEVELAKRIAQGDQEAKNELVNSNLRLVVNIAKHFASPAIPLADLIQDGNIGLTRAAEKFDYTKGFKFSTYATWWIKQAVTRAVADQSRNIRLPVHVAESIRKINKTKGQLTQKLGRDPTDEEIAAAIPGFTETDVAYYENLSPDTVSLDQPVGDDEGADVGDFVKSEDSADEVAEGVEAEERGSLIDKGFEKLDERERDIIIKLFGLEDGDEKSLEEVGKEYGLSRERIRQIRDGALAKMRRSIK